jgi:hypothetical protein
MQKKLGFVALVIATSLTLSACQGVQEKTAPEPSNSQQHANDILTRTLPPEISAYGVLLAAIYLTAGDIDAGILSGKFSPDELLEAKLAIENGTLDLWRERAELDR